MCGFPFDSAIATAGRVSCQFLLVLAQEMLDHQLLVGTNMSSACRPRATKGTEAPPALLMSHVHEQELGCMITQLLVCSIPTLSFS